MRSSQPMKNRRTDILWTQKSSTPALDGLNELEGYRLDNVVPCCRYCNTARDLHLPMEWGRVLDIYRERYGQFVWPTQAGTQHWHPDAFPLRRVLHAIAGSSFAKRILREH